jgi:hypothetical protein
MKYLLYIVAVFLFVSCDHNKKKSNQKNGHIDHQMQIEIDGEHISKEMAKFNKQLTELYTQSEKKPETVIQKIDSLLLINAKATGKYRIQIKKDVETGLNYLKAELYYKLGLHNESLKILHKYPYSGCDTALAIAANYTKLKQYDMAKMYVDSINCYIEDYAWGNYYETVGNKAKAIKIYKEIKLDKKIKHYAYYPLAVSRLEELQKKNPKLLHELYYPTGNPSFETADSDNENRSKIFKMIQSIPECEDYGVHIYQEPQTNDKDYYWIKVSNDMVHLKDLDKPYKAKYNFFIYPKDFSIKYYDEENKKLLSLEEWRKTLKK